MHEAADCDYDGHVSPKVYFRHVHFPEEFHGVRIMAIIIRALQASSKTQHSKRDALEAGPEVTEMVHPAKQDRSVVVSYTETEY